MAGGGAWRLNSPGRVGTGRSFSDNGGQRLLGVFPRLNVSTLVVGFVLIITMETAVEAKCTFPEESHYISSESWLELECECPLLHDRPGENEVDFLYRTRLSMKRETGTSEEMLFSNGELSKNRKFVKLVAKEMTHTDARTGRMKLHLRLWNVTAKDSGVYMCIIVGGNDKNHSEEKNITYAFVYPTTSPPSTTTTPTTSKKTGAVTTSSTTTTTILAFSTGNGKETSSQSNVYIAFAISGFIVIVIVVFIICFVRVRMRRRLRKTTAREKSLDGFEFGQPHAANYNLLYNPAAAKHNADTDLCLSGDGAGTASRGTANRKPSDQGIKGNGIGSVPVIAHDGTGLALSRARALSGEAATGSADELEDISRKQRRLLLDTPGKRPRPSATTPPREIPQNRRCEATPPAGGWFFSPGHARASASRSYDLLDLTDHYDSEPTRRSWRYSVPEFYDDDDEEESAFHTAPSRHRMYDGLPPRSLSQQSLHRSRKRERSRRSRSGRVARCDPAHPYDDHAPFEQAQPHCLIDRNYYPSPTTSPHHRAFTYDEYRPAQSPRGYADLSRDSHRQSPSRVLSPIHGSQGQGAQQNRDDEVRFYHQHRQNHPHSSSSPSAHAVTGHRNGQTSPLVVTVREDNNVAYSDSYGFNSARSRRTSDGIRSSDCSSAGEVFDQHHLPRRGGEVHTARADTTMTSEDEMPMARVGGSQYGNDIIGGRFVDEARPHHQQPEDRGRFLTPAPPHHQHRHRHHAISSLPSQRSRAVTPTRRYYDTSSAPRRRRRYDSRSAERLPFLTNTTPAAPHSRGHTHASPNRSAQQQNPRRNRSHPQLSFESDSETHRLPDEARGQGGSADRRQLERQRQNYHPLPGDELPLTQADAARQYNTERRRGGSFDQSSARGAFPAEEGGLARNGDPRYPQSEHIGDRRGTADTINLLSGETRCDSTIRSAGPCGEGQFVTGTALRQTQLNVPLQGCSPAAEPPGAQDGGENGGAGAGGGGSGQAVAAVHSPPVDLVPTPDQVEGKERRLMESGRTSRERRRGTEEAPMMLPRRNIVKENHHRRHRQDNDHQPRRLQQLDKQATTTTTASDTSPDRSSRRRRQHRHGCRDHSASGSPADFTTSDSDSNNSPTAFGNRRRMSPGRQRHHHHHHHHRNNLNSNLNRDNDHQHRRQHGASTQEPSSGRNLQTVEISLRDIKTDNETRCKRPVSSTINSNTRGHHNDRYDSDRPPVACAADFDIGRCRASGGAALSRSGSGRSPASNTGLQRKESTASRGSRSRGGNQRIDERSRVEEPAVVREGGGAASGRWEEQFGVAIQPLSSDCSRYTENGHGTYPKSPF